jgi:hypothetical protein
MRPRSKKPTKFGSCLEPSPFGIHRQWLFSETRAIAAGREPIVAKRKPVIGENIETPMTGKGDSENETQNSRASRQSVVPIPIWQCSSLSMAILDLFERQARSIPH